MTSTTTPAWLIDSEVGLCPCGCIGTRKKANFVDKTIAGSAALLRRAMFADDISTEAGLLQRVDPRVKVLSLVGLLVVASLVHHIPVLL
ncbi:MAG: cobalt ECF transporter T component CbiQ, partial [Ilumatobacteraceae bacterium]